MGIGRNDRVALVVPSGPEMAVAFLGVMSGATVVTLDTSISANEFRSAFSELGIRALIVQAALDSHVWDVAQACSIPIIELNPSWEAEAGLFSLPDDNSSTYEALN